MARNRKSKKFELSTPDEIFLDSSNLAGMDTAHLEGHFERPLSRTVMYAFAGIALIALSSLSVKAAQLQVKDGDELLKRSQANTLRHIPVFAERGLVYDRNNVPLIWNEEEGRAYIREEGFAHILGYVGLPTEEELETHYSEEIVGRAGVERSYDSVLTGSPGIQIVETNAVGEIASAGIAEPPVAGSNVTLTIDAEIQAKLHSIIKETAAERGFQGGAGIIMDVQTGELIALTSYPEFDPEVLARGDDQSLIASYNSDTRTPFLHRAIAGVYTPGSIIKPFVGLVALNEKIIDPLKQIFSAGYIDVPNPYDPDAYTRFNDWKAHGYVDLRHALAVSSNVYFYEIGGGFKDQEGIGIRKLDDYLSLFGFGEATGIALPGEAEGIVPSPEWKAAAFDGDDWRIGDTYYTSIGQFGFGVTALQMVRAVAALASDGQLLTPRVVSHIDDADESRIEGILGTFADRVSSGTKTQLPFNTEDMKIVREGMRLAVTEGTAAGLNTPSAVVAAKTGTAELGVSKQKVNSWVEGFWPYDNPRYAFTVVMEKGDRKNTIGGVYVMRTLLDWMARNDSVYLDN